MSARLDTPLAELLLAQGLVGRPLLGEALEFVRQRRGQDPQISLALFLLERRVLPAEVLERALREVASSSGEASLPSEELNQLGPYRVIRKLAEGGMGAVYEVEHEATSARQALKVIKPGALLDEDATERLRREARLSAAVVHPQVVRIHAADFEGPVPYLVQDLLGGGTLSERVGRSGPLSPEDAVELVARLAEGLAAAHAAGILHRDLKPDNVLFSEEGVPVLVDFGLSRRVSGNSIQLTQTGEILGTPAYMAPEQAMDASEAREPADVYALGGILYFALEGVAPFQGLTVLEVLHKVLSDPAPAPQSAPPALAALLARVLAKDPEERPGAAELARLLRESLAIEVRPSLAPLAMAAAALTLAGLTALWVLRGPAERAVASPTPSSTSPSATGATPSPSGSPRHGALAREVLEGRRGVRQVYAARELLRLAPEHPAALAASAVLRNAAMARIARVPHLGGSSERGVGFCSERHLFGVSRGSVGLLDLWSGSPEWREAPRPFRQLLSRGRLGREQLWVSTLERAAWIYSVPRGQIGQASPALRFKPPAAWGLDDQSLGGGMGSLAESPAGRYLALGQRNRLMLYDLTGEDAPQLLELPLNEIKDDAGNLVQLGVVLQALEFVDERRLVGFYNMRGPSPADRRVTIPMGGNVVLVEREEGTKLRLTGLLRIGQAVTGFCAVGEELYVGDNLGNLLRYSLDRLPRDPAATDLSGSRAAAQDRLDAKGAPTLKQVFGVAVGPRGVFTTHRADSRSCTLGRWERSSEGWTYVRLGAPPLSREIFLSPDRQLLFLEYAGAALKGRELGELWYVGEVP